MGIGICVLFILAFIIVFQTVLPTWVIIGFAVMGMYLCVKGFEYEEEQETRRKENGENKKTSRYCNTNWRM